MDHRQIAGLINELCGTIAAADARIIWNTSDVTMTMTGELDCPVELHDLLRPAEEGGAPSGVRIIVMQLPISLATHKIMGAAVDAALKRE